MAKYFLTILMLLVSSTIIGKTITFENSLRERIENVKCTAFTDNGDSITSWVSDSRGIITIKDNNRINYFIASRNNYTDRMISIKQLISENNVIVLSSGEELNEIVITPKDIEEFENHIAYRISTTDMARYTNVLQSLNEIPNLTILQNGGAYFEGSPNVKILVDGVEATNQEIESLSKEDIAKVNVYSTPPTRFISEGVSAVVDIRLKSKIHGGNMAINAKQAFQSLIGNNTVALFYNYKQSRFSMLYNNVNNHYHKFRQSEELDYIFNDINYYKIKEGLNSKRDNDNNKFMFYYQINYPNDLLYKVKASVDINKEGREIFQNVNTNNSFFRATNSLRTDYTKYNVGNYFEKTLGAKGIIYADFDYQHFSTSYNSRYNEETTWEGALNNSYSNYNTHLDAFFLQIQYQTPFSKLGMLSFSAHENNKHSKYVNTASPFYQTVNTFGGNLLWLWTKKNLSLWASCGVDWFRTSSIMLLKPHDMIIPTPRLNLNLKLPHNLRFSFMYDYNGGAPTIAQLSETEQWLDTKLVYHGNAQLRPYKVQSGETKLTWSHKYINFALSSSLMSSPDRICEMYTTTDNYMLLTLVNLSKYRTWTNQLDVTIKPLGNNLLSFWNRITYSDLKGVNNEYYWNEHRFQWMSAVSINLKHWSMQLFYQYPGKYIDGQIVYPRAQCWYVSASYRPMTNLSIGLEFFMPFGKGMREREYTVTEAPVYADTEYTINDRSNLISFTMSYNLSFGRNRNRVEPKYENSDNDTGILYK